MFSLQATEWLEFSVLLRYSFLESKCFKTIVCKLAWAAFINHIWGQGNANVHKGVIYNKEKERLLFYCSFPKWHQTFFFNFILFYLSKQKKKEKKTFDVVSVVYRVESFSLQGYISVCFSRKMWRLFLCFAVVCCLCYVRVELFCDIFAWCFFFIYFYFYKFISVVKIKK